MSKRKRSDEEGQEEENFLEVGKEGEKDFRGKGKKTKARRAWNAKKRQTKPTTGSHNKKQNSLFFFFLFFILFHPFFLLFILFP